MRAKTLIVASFVVAGMCLGGAPHPGIGGGPPEADPNDTCRQSVARMLAAPHTVRFEAVLTSSSIREQHQGTWHWQDADHYRMQVERDHRQEYKGKSHRGGGVTVVVRNPAERFVMSKEKGAAPHAQVCRDPAMIRTLELEWNEISDRYPALLWLSHNASFYDWAFNPTDDEKETRILLTGKLNAERYRSAAQERLTGFSRYVPQAARAVESIARVSKRPVPEVLCMLAPESVRLAIDPETNFVSSIELDAAFTFRGAIKKIVWRQKELSLDVKHAEGLFTYEVPKNASIRMLEPPKSAGETEAKN